MRVDASLVTRPDPSLFDPANPALAAQAVGRGGRQAAWFVQGEFGEAVLRHYRRGGWMARVNRRHYLWQGWGTTRSFAEFDLLTGMAQQGLPVPRPIAAAYWRTGLAYRAAILVRRLEGVRPLADALPDAAPERVAHAIFSMHEKGVWHADLNAYNILLDPAGKAWLIDFDRGRRLPWMPPARRRANLLRLRRSLVKVRGPEGEAWWLGLDKAYTRLLDEKAQL